MSIKGQGHSLVKGHSDFKVKCLTSGLYNQVSDSEPHGPLVEKMLKEMVVNSHLELHLLVHLCDGGKVYISNLLPFLKC